LISLIAFFQLDGADARIETKAMELRNQIETEITRNITALMLTQLDPRLFNVAARVQIIETPETPPKPNPKKEPESMPAGMELGSIDVRELIESYKKQIEELKLTKEHIVEKSEPKYSISKIEVIVGLDMSFDEKYVGQFNQWLKARVLSDYGSSASALTNRIKLKEEKPIPEPRINYLREFLQVLPYLLLGLSLLIAALAIGRGLKRLGEGAKSIVIEHKTPLALDGKVEEGSHEKEAKETANEDPSWPAVRPRLEPEPDQLVRKIAFICLELGRQVNDLVRVWLDNGNDGFMKAAVLIDTIVSVREKIRLETGAIPALAIPLDSDLSTSYEENIAEAYRRTPDLQPHERIDLLEKIYWDLISLKTLGVKSLRRPFDFMQSMNDLNFIETIKTQAESAKALALMYSEPARAQAYLTSINNTDRERVLIEMINSSQISKKQLWDLDASVKVNLINQSMRPEENVVDLFPRTVEILKTLGAVEEIRILRRVSTSLMDGGITIKQQFTTLAFVDEWREEYIAKLVNVASSTELVQLIRLVPEVEQKILNACADKMKMIVQDDLRMPVPDDSTIAKNIRILKQKWINVVLAEAIPMSKVVSIMAKAG